MRRLTWAVLVLGCAVALVVGGLAWWPLIRVIVAYWWP
jgi:hypothetical protein